MALSHARFVWPEPCHEWFLPGKSSGGGAIIISLAMTKLVLIVAPCAPCGRALRVVAHQERTAAQRGAAEHKSWVKFHSCQTAGGGAKAMPWRTNGEKSWRSPQVLYHGSSV